MIALAMCYAVVISLPLAVLGLLIEHLAGLRQRPRRWAWIAALVAVVILTALTPLRTLSVAAPQRVAELRDGTAGRVPIRTESRAAAESASGWSMARERLEAGMTGLLRWIVRADPWCRWAWPLGSAGVVIAYGLGRWALARRRRSWREAVVESERVLVTHDDGPALVGVRAPRIVVPEWALELEPAAVRLMLRHEREHQRARDPLLIHLAGLTLVLMPWNPFVWSMLSRLRLAVELDCDARVLGIASGRQAAPSDLSTYGELLLAVVTRRSPRRPVIAPAILEHPSSLTRRISVMYSHVPRLIGLRSAAAGSAALVILALTLVVPVPTVGAQGQGSTTHIAGPAVTPAFRTPSPAALKTFVDQYASEVPRDRPLALVLVLDSSGNVIGTQSTQVLEMLVRLTRPAERQEPVWPDAQLTERQREERARAERERTEVREPERLEVKREPTNEPKAEMSREDEARAKRAIMEQEAAELASRLISIDVVRYGAGELGPAPVNVFFITTTGQGKAK